jgi:hypothetical protein
MKLKIFSLSGMNKIPGIEKISNSEEQGAE